MIEIIQSTKEHNSDNYLSTIFNELDVKNIVITDEFQTRKIWNYFNKKVKEEKCDVITVLDTTHLSTSTIKCKIIHPDKSFSSNNINNMSIVMRIDYKDFSALFTGDLEKEGEQYLIAHYPEFLDCDVLKVCHHGSKTSSSIAFIKAVTPDFAFIPTSLKNRFHFPHKTTLGKFSFLGDYLFIAGKDGALQIETDGENTHFKTYLSKEDFWINDLK